MTVFLLNSVSFKPQKPVLFYSNSSHYLMVFREHLPVSFYQHVSNLSLFPKLSLWLVFWPIAFGLYGFETSAWFIDLQTWIVLVDLHVKFSNWIVYLRESISLFHHRFILLQVFFLNTNTQDGYRLMRFSLYHYVHLFFCVKSKILVSQGNTKVFGLCFFLSPCEVCKWSFALK